MNKDQKIKGLIIYSNLSFTTIIILSFLSALVVVIVGSMSFDLSLTKIIEQIFNLSFKILSLTITVIVPVITFDMYQIEHSDKWTEENILLVRLNSSDNKTKREVVYGVSAIYFFLLTGLIREWIIDIFGESAFVPDMSIWLIIVLGFICGALKINAYYLRLKKSKQKTKK